MWRPFEIARAALAFERQKPPVHRSVRESEFLPAALEITETPPSPTARVLALSICGFLLLAITWSTFGEVDVVATAEGRIIPSGRSKQVQPLETGIVRAIHVKDGLKVRAGEVLVELDTTGTGAERERLFRQNATDETQASRLRAELVASETGDALRLFRPPAAADGDLVESQKRLLASELDEHRAKVIQILDEMQKKHAEAKTISAGIKRLDQTIPLLSERAAARRELSDKGYGSRLQYLELEEQRVANEHERHIQGLKLAETMASVSALESQRQSLDAEFRRQKSAELAEMEAKAAASRQELIKAEQRHVQQTLLAPIDGTVQQLAISTVGGVVTPAQILMIVVPDEDRLEIEAKIQNKDIGFVRVGQPAELKVETFLFTRYGLLDGEVVSVSRDAIVDERQIATFAARIRPMRTTMSIDGHEVPLTAGMSTVAEIKIGSRRVIEFVLSPILRYRQEAFRER